MADYNKTFAVIKKTAGDKLIAWNSFHTLMGKMDMKDAGKIWEKYKKEIAGTGGNTSKINKITAQYVKKIESLGGKVKSLGSKPRVHVHPASKKQASVPKKKAISPNDKTYIKTHKSAKAADSHFRNIKKRKGKVERSGNKLTYSF